MVETAVAGDLARAHLDGTVVDASHREYDRLRRVYNAVIERRPGAIVQTATASDVQKVVGIAADSGLPLAVRGGGHSFAGLGTCDDGIVCDLSRMNAVLVDPQTRTVEVGGGALLGDVDGAGERYGLVTPAGVVSHTGVGGLTLGGGMGYLSRRFGLTIDNLIEADIVTADGRLARVDSNEQPELFWAIRGGGGNFGVIPRGHTGRGRPPGNRHSHGSLGWTGIRARPHRRHALCTVAPRAESSRLRHRVGAGVGCRRTRGDRRCWPPKPFEAVRARWRAPFRA